jgi:hypothetical protein
MNSKSLALCGGVLGHIVFVAMLFVASKLAAHAYSVIIPDIPLPVVTELSMNPIAISVVTTILLFGCLAILVCKKAPESTVTIAAAGVLLLDLVLMAIACRAYLLPFARMT